MAQLTLREETLRYHIQAPLKISTIYVLMNLFVLRP